MTNTVQQTGRLSSQVLQECVSWHPGRQCIVNYIALTWQAWEAEVQAVSQGVPASIITPALLPPSTSPHPAFNPLPMGLFNLMPPSAAELPLGGCSRDGLSQTDSRSSLLLVILDTALCFLESHSGFRIDNFMWHSLLEKPITQTSEIWSRNSQNNCWDPLDCYYVTFFVLSVFVCFLWLHSSLSL